ncbi:MAG: type II secretion system inner membrane protein GspF [Desulfobacterales bacterium]|nr:type II secretion system inner membrane protein GspF [Desulfobacterales bacterium]
MPVYEYTALDKAGKNLKGIVDADSASAARQKLRESGFFPVDVKETSSTPRDEHSSAISIDTFFKRIKPGELSAITRELSILLGAGITLVASLNALVSQVTSPQLSKILAHVKESVNEGNSLAFSLEKHPRVFSQIYVNMVRAGEASGSLDLVLDRLASFSEHQQALRGRLHAAMAYPAFMFLIGAVILFFLITFIVPNITGIFHEMHQTLPLPTLALISVSAFLKSYWWLILIVFGAGAFLVKRLVQTTKGGYIWDKWKLQFPVLGLINTKMAMARFGRTLGSLLQNGVPLLSALEIVRNVVSNNLFAEAIDDAMEQIEVGKSIAEPLAKSRWFPPIAIQMISAGEQSGELDNMLERIADIYEREAESRIMAATSMLEPMMILIMGLAVGFIVVSILLPIFEMNRMIR